MQGMQLPIKTFINYEKLDKDFILYEVEENTTAVIIADAVNKLFKKDIPVGLVFKYIPTNTDIDTYYNMFNGVDMFIGMLIEIPDWASDKLTDDELKAISTKAGIQCTRSVRNRFEKLGLTDSRFISIMRYPAIDTGVYNAGSPLSTYEYSNMWQYSVKGTSAAVKTADLPLAVIFGCNTIEQFNARYNSEVAEVEEIAQAEDKKIAGEIEEEATAAESEETITDIADDITDIPSRVYYTGELVSISKISDELGIEDSASYRKELAKVNNITYKNNTDLNKKLVEMLKTDGIILA